MYTKAGMLSSLFWSRREITPFSSAFRCCNNSDDDRLVMYFGV